MPPKRVIQYAPSLPNTMSVGSPLPPGATIRLGVPPGVISPTSSGCTIGSVKPICVPGPAAVPIGPPVVGAVL